MKIRGNNSRDVTSSFVVPAQYVMQKYIIAQIDVVRVMQEYTVESKFERELGERTLLAELQLSSVYEVHVYELVKCFIFHFCNFL